MPVPSALFRWRLAYAVAAAAGTTVFMQTTVGDSVDARGPEGLVAAAFWVGPLALYVWLIRTFTGSVLVAVGYTVADLLMLGSMYTTNGSTAASSSSRRGSMPACWRQWASNGCSAKTTQEPGRRLSRPAVGGRRRR
jgi:hypothetical protein